MDDRLSSLSDDVLAHILSFLDIQSAVQTSVLSNRWKYLYMFTTGLDIDCSRIQLSSHMYDIDRVVMQHKANITKFTLSMPLYHGDIDCYLLSSWIAVAVSRGVEELTLDIHSMYDCDPGCLFISKTLVVINLSGGGAFLRIPSSACLPNLKILHLIRVPFLDSSSMTRFFDGSPLLQDLFLEECVWQEGQIYTIRAPMLKHLRIEAVDLEDTYDPSSTPKVEFDVPRLKCFEFVGEVSELYCIKSAIDLAIADITIYNISCHIFSLIRGLSNATTLKLSHEIYFRAWDFVDDSSYHRQSLLPELPIFGNLIDLEVSLGPPDSHAILPQILQHLISKSPKLETLVFREGFLHCYENLRGFVHSTIFSCSPNLKVIHVHGFSGSVLEEDMVYWFLGNAVGLQDLKIIKKTMINETLIELQGSESDCISYLFVE